MRKIRWYEVEGVCEWKPANVHRKGEGGEDILPPAMLRCWVDARARVSMGLDGLFTRGHESRADLLGVSLLEELNSP